MLAPTSRPPLRVTIRPARSGDRPTLAADVENLSDRPAPGVAVAWVTTRRSAPVKAGGLTLIGLGGSIAFDRVAGPADLPPAGRATFAVPPALMPAVLSEAAALGPDEYAVAVRVGGEECGRYPGAAAALILDGIEAGPRVVTPPAPGPDDALLTP